MVKKLIHAFIIIIFSFSTVIADYVDIIYLKNGTIIKGVIIEQIPGESLTIETIEGNKIVCSFDDITKILKEKVVEKEVEKKVKKPQMSLEELAFKRKKEEYNSKRIDGWMVLGCSCVPIGGTGYFFGKEPTKGAIFLAGDVVWWVGFITIGIDSTIGIVTFIGIYVAARVYEYVDAFAVAERYNKKLKKKIGLPEDFELSYSFEKDKYNISNTRLGLHYRF